METNLLIPKIDAVFSPAHSPDLFRGEGLGGMVNDTE